MRREESDLAMAELAEATEREEGPAVPSGYSILLTQVGGSWRAEVTPPSGFGWRDGYSLSVEDTTCSAAAGRAWIAALSPEAQAALRLLEADALAGAKEPVEDTGPAERFHRRVLLRFGTVAPVHSGMTGNLSESGLFILTDRPPAVGSHLRIDLQFPTGTLLLTGEVVWIRRHGGGPTGCGVRLLHAPPVYVELLRTFFS